MQTLIHQATIINENKIFTGSVLIEGERIKKIFTKEIPDSQLKGIKIIEAKNKYLIPGGIDEHVHFRDPGLSYKADISSESKAALAGGITSYMDMPNTNPQTITQSLLEKKYEYASKRSAINYSFYIGATNENIEEIIKTNPSNVCGIKVFMGSSTGNMLVDNDETLSEIFKKTPMLVVLHCEDENIIRKNTEIYRQKYGENVPISCHPLIRSREACYKSTLKAVNLATKYNTRLHILHLTTAEEMNLFSSGPVKDKKITAEVCIQHLYFDDRDYQKYGTRIKCNPAIKSEKDKQALWQSLLSDKIDTIATDHAPHLLSEKNNSYFKAPSGGPSVQHSLIVMFEFVKKGKITAEKVVEKMCHAPADLFNIDKRGYIREGYYADLVLIDPNKKWTVAPENILYKCGWSPFEGITFSNKIEKTFINGKLGYDNGIIIPGILGKRLKFNR